MDGLTRRAFLVGLVSLPVIGVAAKFVLRKAHVCVWNMGTPCKGEVEEQGIFQNQIVVPMCDKHYFEHKVVMALYEKGQDVEKVLEMSDSERYSLARGLGLSDRDILNTAA